MTKLFKKLPLRFRFRDRGAVPTPRLIWGFLILSAPIALTSVWANGWLVFIVFNLVLLFVSLLDWWILPRRSRLQCERRIDEEVERGREFTVQLQLANHSAVPIRFRLIDGLPDSFQRPFPLFGEIPGKESILVSYTSEAAVRGDYSVENVYFRYRSPLGLWEKQMLFPCSDPVRVIPDMSKVREYLASAQQYLLHEGEKVRLRRVGSGEFAQIRSYVPGDDPRKINWRQTAKLAEMMTNVYEPEHGKHIVLLIDCGRMMGVELTKGNRLEYSLEAALTVAAAALKKGDYVSVLAFSDRIKAYVPPGKTSSHLQTIIRGVYNLQSDPVESNYTAAFQHLETVQKRRSFILLFSNLDSLLFEEMALQQIQRIRRRHLFLLMGIADAMIAEWTRAEPRDTQTAMVKSTAQRHVLRRKREMVRRERLGMRMLEVPEDRLAAEALSRYLEIVNRGVI